MLMMFLSGARVNAVLLRECTLLSLCGYRQARATLETGSALATANRRQLGIRSRPGGSPQHVVCFLCDQIALVSEKIYPDILPGLNHRPAEIAAKLFYDQRGCELFEAITACPVLPCAHRNKFAAALRLGIAQRGPLPKLD